jgi:hypothetical protein
MQVKRNKPAMGVTLDSDIVEWVKQEAERGRCKPSHIINRILAEKMEQEQAEKKMNGRSLKSQLAS